MIRFCECKNNEQEMHNALLELKKQYLAVDKYGNISHVAIGKNLHASQMVIELVSAGEDTKWYESTEFRHPGSIFFGILYCVHFISSDVFIVGVSPIINGIRTFLPFNDFAIEKDELKSVEYDKNDIMVTLCEMDAMQSCNVNGEKKICFPFAVYDKKTYKINYDEDTPRYVTLFDSPTDVGDGKPVMQINGAFVDFYDNGYGLMEDVSRKQMVGNVYTGKQITPPLDTSITYLGDDVYETHDNNSNITIFSVKNNTPKHIMSAKQSSSILRASTTVGDNKENVVIIAEPDDNVEFLWRGVLYSKYNGFRFKKLKRHNTQDSDNLKIQLSGNGDIAETVYEYHDNKISGLHLQMDTSHVLQPTDFFKK